MPTQQPKKRILYVITKSNFGGAQRYVYELSTAMKSGGHTVAVAHGGNGLLVNRLIESGVTLYPVKSFQRDISLKKELFSLFDLAKIIREFDPDIVHLNSSKAGVVGAFISKLLGVPMVIFTAHGWPYLERRNWFWRIFAYIGSGLTGIMSHKVIAVSENDLRNSPVWVKSKATVIHTAVPKINFFDRDNARYKLFSEADIDAHQKDIWLITIAELNHNKNLFTAIEAVAEYNASNHQKIFYCIIGEGELHQKITSYLKEKNLLKCFKLLGYINDSREYLKAFDLFLLPSKKEGLPYSILEAGAAGLPIIASKVGGVPEIIEHNQTGKLIDPNNYKTIVRALDAYVTEYSKINKQANLLMKKIDEDYSLPMMLNKTKNIYEDTSSRA